MLPLFYKIPIGLNELDGGPTYGLLGATKISFQTEQKYLNLLISFRISNQSPNRTK